VTITRKEKLQSPLPPPCTQFSLSAHHSQKWLVFHSYHKARNLFSNSYHGYIYFLRCAGSSCKRVCCLETRVYLPCQKYLIHSNFGIAVSRAFFGVTPRRKSRVTRMLFTMTAPGNPPKVLIFPTTLLESTTVWVKAFRMVS